MKKFISILLAITILTAFTSTFAEKADLNSISYSEAPAMGLTYIEISTYKNGNSATFDVTTNSSHVASQIGFRNGYIQTLNNGVWVNNTPLNTYYSTNTDYNYKYLGFTMSSGVTYRISVEHYCIINGTTYYQQQYSNSFGM